MSLSVFYPKDIKNALLAAEQATNAMAEFGGKNSDYMAGYRAALTTLALAFGLAPRPPNFPREVEYRLGVGVESEPG